MNKKLLRRFKLIQHDPKAAPLHFRKSKRVARRLECYGSSVFARLYAGETGREIPVGTLDHDLARSVFFTSVDDWLAKQRKADFYDANAALFMRYVPRACAFTDDTNRPYASPASHMIGDALHVLQQHSQTIGSGRNDYGYWAASHAQFFHLYQASVRIADGQRIDDAQMGANTIRLAIETRLKSAIGIFSIYNEGTGRIVDAKMTHIFEVFEKHAADIEIAVDLHVVRMIYDWSCNYIHSGMVSYKWLIYFAHDLLAPLFTPHVLKRNTPNWDFGIVMRRSTLEVLRDAVGKMRVKKASFHINGPPVDQCAVGLLPDINVGGAGTEIAGRG